MVNDAQSGPFLHRSVFSRLYRIIFFSQPKRTALNYISGFNKNKKIPQIFPVSWIIFSEAVRR